MQLVTKMNVLKLALLVSLAGLVTSCGGSVSNNDQGVSFLFLGYAPSADGDDDETDGADFLTGVTVPLSTPGDETPGNVGGVFAALRLQNNLSGQFIRLQRAFFEYEVPGAQVNPPSTSIALAGVLGPGTTDTSTGVPIDTTLPPGAGGTSNIVTAETLIIPPEVLTWINLNRTLLPEPPFTMIIRGRVTGFTSSGDRLTTNDQDLAAVLTPDLQIGPTPGDETEGDDEDTDAFEDGTFPSDEAQLDDDFPVDNSTGQI